MDPATLEQYLDYPIQAPPDGVTANFVNPESTAYQVYITAGVCLALMVVFSLTRLLSKIYFGPRKIKIDEIVFVSGLFLCFMFIAMTVACVSGSAFGRHSWDVLLGAFTKPQLVLSLLVEIFLPMAICLVKVSVLILYWQIFQVLRWMRIACIVSITCITAFHLSLSIAFAVMCAPSTGSSQIDFLAAFISDTCSRTRALVVIQGAGNVISDVFLVVLPLPAVLKLQMPLKRKIAVSSMFLVGISACASSIISLIYRVQYYTAGDDNTRLVVPLWATSMAEEAAAVMICCAPTTASFYKLAKPSVRTWLSSASGRALRLSGSGSHRTDMPGSGSQSNLKGSLDSGWNAAYSHAQGREHNPERETDAYSLGQMNQKRTPASVGV